MICMRPRVQALLVILWTANFTIQAQAIDCKESGFSGKPSCADCQKLFEFVKDAGLHEDCKLCCEEGNGDSDSASFDRAALEICKYRLREFPQVEGFIQQKLPSYSNVQISYKWGASPRLILRGADKRKEAIRIDSWTTDNIVEYLEKKSITMQAGAT